MSISKQQFSSFIIDFKFRELFNEMGWNNDNTVIPVSISDEIIELKGVAVKSGFKILTLQSASKNLPSKEIRKKIQRTISKYYYEHLIIYFDAHKANQIWQTAIRLPNKPIKIHEVAWNNSQDPEILYQRASGLFFTFEEEAIITIVDVLKRIQDNFNANSEKVTKKFYERFKKEHSVFYSFIDGIDKETDKRWYASLMLNRLMFIYFIQKKGFLDSDANYLKNKLIQITELRGTNKFYKSFYKVFLCRLFHEGLGKPHAADKELINLIGKIPYLNGGLFDLHELEKDNENIDVKDEAFVRLFDFFDEYNWHLDDRITASGKDINPDVLGYIFEKYINDRASMGAYYTKEDITEYISKNCIIPFLFDKTKENCANAFLPASSLWLMLKQDPNRYIYDAVKHGISYDSGIREGLPDDIIEGLDTSDPDLIEKRKAWNRLAPTEIALPTEIYREVIERRKRYFDIRQKVENGEISEISDFITCNLNIRQFAQDALENYEGSDFIESFFSSIAGRKYDEKDSSKEPTMGITVLDPTCGSGAFLFAALNVLEPLYEACIKRMREFVNADSSGKKYKQFRIVLREIENHPSESYYILKSIILNNLYGVDIMKEAVETAKLRLFLKLVAQTDDIDNVEPLPDIDFNIRCGNTLVGFASEEDLRKGLTWTLDGQAARPAIEESCETVAMAFTRYKQIQLKQSDAYEEFCQAKKELNKRLKTLNERLNKLLYLQASGLKYDRWLSTHQPFHWFAEFYEIVHDNGGFDIIIGNPPYIEYSSVKKTYSLKNFECLNSGNLYAFVIERGINIMKAGSRIGMIIQMSAFCTPRMKDFQKVYFKKSKQNYISFFDDRPGKLFDGLEHIRVAICLLELGDSNHKSIGTTNYIKFKTEFRPYLFDSISYFLSETSRKDTSILKVNNYLEQSIIDKMWYNSKPLSLIITEKENNNFIYYGYGYGYFGKILNYKSFFKGEKIESSTGDKYIFINNPYDRDIIVSLMNSTLFYWFYVNYSDGHNFTKFVIGSIPFCYPNKDLASRLKNLTKKLMIDLKKKSSRKTAFYKATGNVEYDEYYPKRSKDIIDQIDTVLADHYGFTNEELDFVINYDIKYRMGKEIDNGEDEE